MHGNIDMIKTICQNYDWKSTSQGYINKPSPFTKIKSKWPLLGGSRFNIYFHTEHRENRGFNQDFHGISFFEDYSLINYHMLT